MKHVFILFDINYFLKEFKFNYQLLILKTFQLFLNTNHFVLNYENAFVYYFFENC